jgi:16S rRNA (uracil1498-N3)-methyltransferase
MSAPRFFCDAKLGPGAQLELPDNAAHHAQRVLRLKAGDKVRLFNGDGHDYDGELLRVAKDGVTARITGQQHVDRESPLNVTLAQCISSGDRMDFTLQKSVELGIARIQPLAAERSVVKLSGDRVEKRVHHWQNVVASACEQSGRAFVPEVLPPLPLMHWLGQSHDFALRLMLNPFTDRRLQDLQPPNGPVCLLIGCEGGFAPGETTAALNAGFTDVKLGPRILRTETAGLAALTALQALWGDF